MGWNPAISRQINVSFEAGEIEEFTRLLRAQPEYLHHADGTDLWMWRAAIEGWLSFVQVLVGLGVDVNIPKDLEVSGDPFCMVEGPIVHAASEGHFEMVRWLLEHGARINYVVNSTPRCLPLLRAATNGHLDVVKLLVESGADWKSSWNGHTALSQAENHGHHDVRDYLRSLK